MSTWIMQIILSELLGVPVSVELGEPNLNADETLMTGTLKDPLSLSSNDFADGAGLGAEFEGNSGATCTGTNSFPHLEWNEIPWGTKKMAIIVEDTTDSDKVHLNLVDIDPTLGSIAKVVGSSGPIDLSGIGTEGTNGFSSTGWVGPCGGTSGSHTYKFTIYALSQAIGAAVNNTSSSSFESTYSNEILGQASITGTFSQ